MFFIHNMDAPKVDIHLICISIKIYMYIYFGIKREYTKILKIKEQIPNNWRINDVLGKKTKIQKLIFYHNYYL